MQQFNHHFYFWTKNKFLSEILFFGQNLYICKKLTITFIFRQKQIFDDMLENLEQEFDFEVFRLHDKYDDELDIWVDHDHLISHNKKTDFYSEEIAKMLLTEMKEQ